MEFLQITLFTSHLTKQRSYYCEVLGFKCIDSPDSFQFTAGSTKVTFKEGERGGVYHFAFLIPNSNLSRAIKLLEEKGVTILTLKNDKIIHFDDGKSIYFKDPDGNIVEFIERPSLGIESEGEFDLSKIVKMNEIGLVVDDPLLSSEEFMSLYLIKPYKPSLLTPEFCWVGDMNGAFIVVKKERHWLPTTIAAKPVHFTLEFLSESNNNLYLIYV